MQNNYGDQLNSLSTVIVLKENTSLFSGNDSWALLFSQMIYAIVVWLWIWNSNYILNMCPIYSCNCKYVFLLLIFFVNKG